MATKTDSTGEPTGVPALPTKQTAKPTAEPAPQPQTDATAADDVVVQPDELDTPESDAAIDDIVAKEADEVLAAQDAGIAAAEADSQPAEPQKHGHPIFWFFILLLVIIAGIAMYVLMNPGLDLPFSA